MMQLELTKRYTFEARHRLPWHQGQCARDHGHSYVLEVTVAGPVKPDSGAPDSGMVVDFATLSAVVKPLIAQELDHHSLNDFLANPTAEGLLLWLRERLAGSLPNLCRLRLYETATGWAEWRKED